MKKYDIQDFLDIQFTLIFALRQTAVRVKIFRHGKKDDKQNKLLLYQGVTCGACWLSRYFPNFLFSNVAMNIVPIFDNGEVKTAPYVLIITKLSELADFYDCSFDAKKSWIFQQM